ncbi:MAG: hypothetical protein ABIE14_03690 [Patescibacteria group bacterium]
MLNETLNQKIQATTTTENVDILQKLEDFIQNKEELKKELLDELKGFEEMKNETETKRLLLKAKAEKVGDDFSEYEKLFEDAKETLDKIILRLEEIKVLNDEAFVNEYQGNSMNEVLMEYAKLKQRIDEVMNKYFKPSKPPEDSDDWRK